MGSQCTAVIMLYLQKGIALSLQDCTLQAAFTQAALGAAVRDRPTLASTEPAVHAPHALGAGFSGPPVQWLSGFPSQHCPSAKVLPVSNGLGPHLSTYLALPFAQRIRREDAPRPWLLVM